MLEYHLLNCYTCDMHLCTKLKLKLLKYHSTVVGGLVELWPKIQQYISRLCPAALSCTAKPQMASSSVVVLGKQGIPSYVPTDIYFLFTSSGLEVLNFL